MRRADRLFELIHLLRRARRAITAAQLAETLEVAPRTIYRDIAALMAMGVPIDGAAGVGYIMRPGYDLPPLMFDREEVEAVAVGLQLLTRTGDQRLCRQRLAASPPRSPPFCPSCARTSWTTAGSWSRASGRRRRPNWECCVPRSATTAALPSSIATSGSS